MNQRVEILVSEAANLTLEERLALVDRILATVNPTNPVVDAAWLSEAEDRMAEYDAGAVETHDADAVLAELRAKARTRA